MANEEIPDHNIPNTNQMFTKISNWSDVNGGQLGTPVFLCSYRHLLYNTKGKKWVFLVNLAALALFALQLHNLINQDNCQTIAWPEPSTAASSEATDSPISALYPSIRWISHWKSSLSPGCLIKITQMLFSDWYKTVSQNEKHYPFQCVYPSDYELF